MSFSNGIPTRGTAVSLKTVFQRWKAFAWKLNCPLPEYLILRGFGYRLCRGTHKGDNQSRWHWIKDDIVYGRRILCAGCRLTSPKPIRRNKIRSAAG